MRYEYFIVVLRENGFVIKNDTGDISVGHGMAEAFNELGKIGACLKMQTESGIFIFERPLPDEGKLIKCSGCLNQFTRDKVIYVNNLPYCSHCLNDERMNENAEMLKVFNIDSLVDEIKKYLDLATKGRESAINEKNDTQKSHYNSEIACYYRCLSIIEKYIGGYEDE